MCVISESIAVYEWRRRGHHTAGESASGLAGSGDGGCSASEDLLGSGVSEEQMLKTTSPACKGNATKALHRLWFQRTERHTSDAVSLRNAPKAPSPRQRLVFCKISFFTVCCMTPTGCSLLLKCYANKWDPTKKPGRYQGNGALLSHSSTRPHSGLLTLLYDALPHAVQRTMLFWFRCKRTQLHRRNARVASPVGTLDYSDESIPSHVAHPVFHKFTSRCTSKQKNLNTNGRNAIFCFKTASV